MTLYCDDEYARYVDQDGKLREFDFVVPHVFHTTQIQMVNK